MKDMEILMQQLAQLPTMIDKFNRIGEYLGHLEQGLVTLSTEGHATKLINGLLLDLLVEKEIVEKEELNQLIEKRVNIPMQEYIEAVNKRLQGQAEEIKDKIKEQTIEEKKEEIEEDDNDSTVVLASERFKNNKKDE